MIYIICFIGGMIESLLVGLLILSVKTARGYYKLEKMPDEDGLYTINIRLKPDQKLNKVNRIILTRE